MNDHITFSLFEFFEKFPTADAARVYLEEKRWNGKPVCPHCGCDHSQYATTRKDRKGKIVAGYYHCHKCKKVYTVRTGTVMERSHIPLNKWLMAIYCAMTCRKGISSYQLSKFTSVTQKSVWFMLQRIREACSADNSQKEMLEGIVEVDEVYIGGKEMNKHESKKLKAGRGTIGKTPVVGIKQRDGKVYAFVVPNTTKHTVHKLLNKWVKPGSKLHTDEASIYEGLSQFERQQVNHGKKEFSRDGVTTNAIESVWACVRRAIIGTWHCVSAKHLQRYIDEVCARLNEGNVEIHLTDRIDSVIEGMLATPHLTYADLIADEDGLLAA